MESDKILFALTQRDAQNKEYEIRIVKLPVAKVELISFTEAPAHTMAMITDTYKGRMDAAPRDLEEIWRNLEDIAKTKLQTPLEFIHMTWLIKDVTRAFTHQLVRYRVGTSFCQESMRFYGKHGVYRVLATHAAAKGAGLIRFADATCIAIKAYVDMIDSGVPAEDARGILPTNILTNIFFDCSLRTLQGIMPQRMCCQAQQGEWQPVLSEMRKQIAQNMGGLYLTNLLQAPYERGEPCGYRASFDRRCQWQDSN